jgi:hypothetical protein
VASKRGSRHANLKNRDLDGPEALLVAVIRQVIHDARSHVLAPRDNTFQPTLREQLNAIEWLLASEEVAEFAQHLDMDEQWLRNELLIDAGIAMGSTRRGQRRTPKPPPLPRRKRRQQHEQPTAAACQRPRRHA